MDLKRLRLGELLALLGGVLLALGLFLPWYEPAPDNPNANIDGMRGALSGWEVHAIVRYLWLAAAIAPLILVYIILRDHELSWGRGEVTAVVAVAAFGLIVYCGLLDRPGNTSQVGLNFGYWVAFAGVVLMFYGGARRSAETERVKKPPGVL